MPLKNLATKELGTILGYNCCKIDRFLGTILGNSIP